MAEGVTTSSSIRYRRRLYVTLLLLELAGLLALRPLQVHPHFTALVYLALPGVVLLFSYSSSLVRRSRSRRWLTVLWSGTAVMEVLWQLALRGGGQLLGHFGLLHLVFWQTLMLYLLWRLVVALIEEPSFNTTVVMGAAAGYLMLGYAGGIALTTLYALEPAAFLLPPPPAGTSGALVYAPHLLAGSFTALTTLGSGLINPAVLSGQTVVLLITAMGQLYVAILIGSVLGKDRTL
jgi:hypothetical protein